MGAFPRTSSRRYRPLSRFPSVSPPPLPPGSVSAWTDDDFLPAATTAAVEEEEEEDEDEEELSRILPTQTAAPFARRRTI